MTQGRIDVQTENIFPIIKKFLYSDHEIFLRELVSNAVDATQKAKRLSSMGEIKGDLGDTKIGVKVDKEAKTITINDKGIGMTEEEVKKYITQVAFSSAEEFLEKFKSVDDKATIIGHFGLGFYSSFMVAEKVEIITRSYKEAPAVKWSCNGSPEYEIQEHPRKERGTDVILYINDESEEFLEKARIQHLLKKYCKFLPVEIEYDGEVINNTHPAWTKAPADLTDEDYIKFYEELYPYSEQPLFWIHLNVDFPFNLTGILYFPKLKNTFEVQKNKIQLYSNQVFVTDSVEEIVPEFLMMLHGVIDSPDIPLNVSRSYLQSDKNVKKINSYITKKVGDKLEDIFKHKREEFEQKWDEMSVFVKYGMMSEDKFYEKAKDFCLLKNTEGDFFTIEEYKEKVKAGQTDRNDKVIFLYATDADEQHGYMENAKAKGYDVLLLNTLIDSHFINTMEQNLESASFVRVDSDTVDKLIDKDDKKESALSEDEQVKVKELFEKQINNPGVTVQLEPLSPEDQPICITKPEFMRRMKEMSAASGMGRGSLPDHYNVVVNANHPIVAKLTGKMRNENKEKLVQQLYDIALLSQNMLKGQKLTSFLKRSVEMMQ